MLTVIGYMSCYVTSSNIFSYFQLLKDVSLVGFYDAIVTHADSRAIELFASCDFSDDIILNSRFR